MISTGGEKVFPGVVDAGVVGLPHEQYSEVASALIELDPRSEASPPAVEGITLYVRNRLAAYKVPRNIVVASRIPRHQNRKLDHGAVLEAILPQFLTTPARHCSVVRVTNLDLR
jgi:acyl-coenzyme A synthetase/AMP-(fatty) acid ligase